MSRKQGAYAALLALVVVVTVLSALRGRTIGDAVLRVSVNSWVGFGPLFVAEKKGIFERNNLQVEIIKMENAPDRRAALISKRVDILGSTLDDLAVSLSQGVESVAFGCADFSNGGDGIIAANEISSLEDLAGAEIAVQPGFVNHFFLLYALKKNDVPINDLRINPMTPDDAGAAFIAGSIDAAVTWEPHISQALDKREGAVLLADSSEYPEAILDLFVASRAWFESNPEAVASFRKSWDEALDFLESNEQESLMIIAENLGLEPVEISAMLSGAKLLKNDACSSLLAPILSDLAADVEEIWTNAGYVDTPIDIEANVFLP